MSIHPEDAMSYADQLHRDLEALTAAVERIADLLALSLNGGIASEEDADGAVLDQEDVPF